MSTLDDIFNIAVEALTAVNNRDAKTLQRLIAKIDEDLRKDLNSKDDGGQ